MNLFKKSVSVFICSAMLFGCSTTATMEANKINEASAVTTKNLTDKLNSQSHYVREVNGGSEFWVSASPVGVSDEDLKDKSWVNDVPALFNLSGKLSFKEVLSVIKDAYPKLKFDVNSDVYSFRDFVDGGSSSSGSSLDSGIGASDSSSDPASGGVSSSEGTSSSGGDTGGSSVTNYSSGSGVVVNYNTDIRLMYDGNLAGLFDKISDDIDIAWSVDSSDPNTIKFYRFATERFKLNVIAGSADSSSGLDLGASSGGNSSGGNSSGGSSGGSTGGGATMSAKYSNTTDLMSEVVQNIEAILSSKGSLTVTPGLGILTIKDSPKYIKKVAKVVSNFNNSLSSQIVLDVKVYSLKKTDSDGYGLNWTAFYQSIKGKFNIALQTAAPNIAGATALTSTILMPNSPYNGTKSIVEALSTLGNVSIVTETEAVTVDNMPLPISQSNTISYIAEVTPATTDATTGQITQGSITPGSVTVGFSMLVTPKIIDNGQIMLQFAIDMSELTALVTRRSSAAADAMQIDTPEISRNTFLQRAIVKSGQTLIMTGFNKKTATVNNSGVGHSSNWLLGGSKNSKVVDEYLVLVVSPRIVESAVN